jgi:hypothetical protein
VAFPTVPTVADGRVLTTNQLDTVAARTFPNIGSLTKGVGDLLLALVVAYQSSVTNSAFSSWGGGFTEFFDSGTSTTLAMGAAYKWSTGSETGTFSVTQAATITGHASMILLAIPGAHATTPPQAGSRADGTSSAALPAAFNPSAWDVEETLWIAFAANGMTSGTGSWQANNAGPTNYTDYVGTAPPDNSTVGQVGGAVAFRQLSAASEQPGGFSTDTSNAKNSAAVIAVRPAAIVDNLNTTLLRRTKRYTGWAVTRASVR